MCFPCVVLHLKSISAIVELILYAFMKTVQIEYLIIAPPPQELHTVFSSYTDLMQQTIPSRSMFDILKAIQILRRAAWFPNLLISFFLFIILGSETGNFGWLALHNNKFLGVFSNLNSLISHLHPYRRCGLAEFLNNVGILICKFCDKCSSLALSQ